MANNEGRGSILLKLVILVLAIVLIAVIIIPAQLWEQEARETQIARANMSSIYEAENFYHRLNKSFTADPAELLRVVRQDSSLIRLQQVVNYTNELAGLIDKYKKIPLVKNLAIISENIDRIGEDLESNKRNFRIIEDIKNEAEDLKLQVSSLNSSEKHLNYVATRSYLDSLTQLRRDMSDFSLQSCAAKAKNITDTLGRVVDKVDIAGLTESWSPLSRRLELFIKTVNNSELVNITSVGDRLKDFRQNIDNAVSALSDINLSDGIRQAEQINQEVGDRYQAYLSDFLITSKRALYKLSEADSMVLHLTENNFYCPVSGDQVKILMDPDSAAVRIESPVLVEELKTKLDPIVVKVKGLGAQAAFNAYADSLNRIKEKAYAIRKQLRKNTDIFIKYKEIEEIVSRFSKISVFTAKQELGELTQKTDSSQSYSALKGYAEKGLEGIRIFKQAYGTQVFGNLDSLHKDIVKAMVEFNELLSSVRRLPKSVVNFEMDIQNLDDALILVKGAQDSNYDQIEQGLGEIYLFASEGSSVRRYGVFSKKIVNFGYIYKGTKSWEDE